MIAIIDYGAGNLHSVKNALDFLGAENIITGDAEESSENQKHISCPDAINQHVDVQVRQFRRCRDHGQE